MKHVVIFCVFLFPYVLQAAFDLGSGEESFGWGARLKNEESHSDMSLRMGFRLQNALEFKNVMKEGSDTVQYQDFYTRRLRFQFEAKFNENMGYYMDIRNDRPNQSDRGEGQFQIGDGFVEIKNPWGNKNMKIRLFRAKVDVSRTQTVSSSRLILQDRAEISDFASGYVSQARRATNAQILGHALNKKITYQVVLGDGIQSDDLEDANGNSAKKIIRQNLMYGGKVKFSPLSGWEEGSVKETYMGLGKHFTFGVGRFQLDDIQFQNSSDDTFHIDRSLTNIELSFHYYAFSFLGEYFVFENMIQDMNASTLKLGTSSGGFIQMEYVMTDFHHLAPMIRFESWDRFNEDHYQQNVWIAGITYYAQGNKIKTGFFYEQNRREENLAGGNNQLDEVFKLTSQWHY